jgi:acetyl-CoA C-acetyltransferase
MLPPSIVITGLARTPIGHFMGALASITAPQLGGAVIRSAVDHASSSLDANDRLFIDEVIMGCVLPAGLKQAPARQACLNADLPVTTKATTINKVCGSGMASVMLAHDSLLADSLQNKKERVFVAGGMESMSNAPHLLPHSRQGYRFGSTILLDHMAMDGLEDAYTGKAMGVYAEECAEAFQLTREAQDSFALESLKRAHHAIKEGYFDDEIIGIHVNDRRIKKTITQDEAPFKMKPERISQLRSVFKKEGTITAANASSIADGAAALVLMTEKNAQKKQIKPLAKIIGHASIAQAPKDFTTAPIEAIKTLLNSIQWSIDDVDLFEINEAFAVVTMAAIQSLHLDPKKVNIHGGACALGHPLGASGTRIIVTLIQALKIKGLSKGVATLCIGGGEATAIAIELTESSSQ